MTTSESYDDFSGAVHDSVSKLPNRIPLEGMIELTRLCSLKCTHCYIGDARWVRDPDEMTTTELKELLDVLAARGTLWLCFTGGEALARPDFKEIWRYAKQSGFILTLFSNATLISESMADFLAELPPFNIEVSIYGATAETYERVTQVRGSYRRFINGVERILARGLPLRLKTVLIKENAHELAAMSEMADKWGVKFHFDGNINPSIGKGVSSGKAPCASRVSTDTLVEAEIGDSGRQAELVEHLQGPRPVGRSATLFSCGAGKNSFYIAAQGQLQMCILTGHRGHALRKSDGIAQEFAAGWDRFGKLRELQRSPTSPCLTCDIADICENCPGFSWLETGDEHQAVEFLCRNAHKKAAAMGLRHMCQPNHFVHNEASMPVVGV